MSKLTTVSRGLSTSCKQFMPKKKPKYLFPALHQAKAQKNFDKQKYKEIVKAQKLRHIWGKLMFVSSVSSADCRWYIQFLNLNCW